MTESKRPRLKSGKAAKCPICGKPASAGDKPFCSDRCRQVDLNRWLGEQYRIPTEEPADPESYDVEAGPPPGRNGPGSW